MIGSRLFLGICYLNIERPEKALPHLRAAHARQPTIESALSLGHAYMGHFLYTKAIQKFEAALPHAREQAADVLYLLGKSYLLSLA